MICEVHDIREAWKNDLIYRCSRCEGCYVCEHQTVFVDDVLLWYCKDGVIRPVIRDGGVF